MFEPPDRGEPEVLEELRRQFGDAVLACRRTRDGMPVAWVGAGEVRHVLRHLRTGVERPYGMLYDLFGIDERMRGHRADQPPSDFTVVYQLLSLERCDWATVKVPLREESCSVPTVCDLWPSANWYECELWDMFGVQVEGHPHLRRLLMPQDWPGHPLRKEHPARATEMPAYELPEPAMEAAERELEFVPEDWGLRRRSDGTEYMFLNVGPAHTGTHGLVRIILQLDGERIEDGVCDIGYHHRGVEKMGERQTWHSFIPYTDRVEYLGGVMNNLPYVLAVERLAGIGVPERAEVIRVMTAELCRIASHLVWYGTFTMDVGQMSPVFYMFTDRERVFDIITAICGGRMHPGWFRIGGVAQDLPEGWHEMVTDFVRYMGPRIDQFDKLSLGNRILKARSIGVGAYTTQEAVDWAVTGPGLRATGCQWDFRKKMPYSGYDRFEFEIPTGERGDVYDRARVRAEEMRQSLRIIQQCADNMPAGPYKADHPLATPPRKEATMQDIETLITHFLSVSWGPVVPPGEAFASVEATKGGTGYYLVSDGGVTSYRTRIRTPSFAHIQMVPYISRGQTVADLLAILGGLDYVLSDVDR